MKGPLFSKAKWLLGGLLLVAYAQNCTKADFTAAPSDATTFSSANAQGTPGGGIDTSVPTTSPTSPTPTPATPGTPSTPGAGGYPKLSFDLEYCAHNTDCPKTMMLSRTDSRAILLKWKTNELRANANPSVFCPPTTGYVPTSGEVTFRPGETDKTIFVHQIACAFNEEIPITVTQCYANGVQFDCSLLQ